MSYVWSEEAVERLKVLHAQGLSGSELASRLGGGLTRSAIFGKLHRLGLTAKTGAPKRRSPSPVTNCQAASDLGDRAARGGAVHGAGPMRFNFARMMPRSRCASGCGVPHSEGRLLPPPSLRIGIVDIGDGQCRFIDGDDGRACGHPVADGSSWCPAHHAVVFVTEAA